MLPDKWLITDFNEHAERYTYYIQLFTDEPIHLWMRWSRERPRIHKLSRKRRGVMVFDDVYFCFVWQGTVEQEEIGDTLVHTFRVTPWPACATRWFYFWGTMAGIPSSSRSPLFGRHINFAVESFFTRIIHICDEATHAGGAWQECSFVPTPMYLVGRWQTQAQLQGSGLRFQNFQLPPYAYTLTAWLTFRAYLNESKTPINSRISVEGDSNPPNFTGLTWLQFKTRWLTRQGIVNYDNIEPWIDGLSYHSSDIAPCLNALSFLPGWEIGNNAVFFWEDFERRTPWQALAVRRGRSFLTDPDHAASLFCRFERWFVNEVTL